MNSRVREVIRDTVIENVRKGGFIRIYPTKTSDIYDKYFMQSKQLNLAVHRALFTNEFIPFPTGYHFEQTIMKSPLKK